MNSMESTKDLAVGIKTVAASSGAALFRIFLMPVDTVSCTICLCFVLVLYLVAVGG